MTLRGGGLRNAPVAVAAGVLSGLLASVANPRPDVGVLAFVALIPLLWAIRGKRPIVAAAAGFAFGMTYYGILLYWLLRFGVVAWLPLVLSQALYAGLFAGIMPGLWRPNRAVTSAIGTAALWVGVDWARSVWPVGGFTWGGLGYTQHDNPLLLPLARVTGVWGITFIVVAVNALLLAALLAAFRRGDVGAGHRRTAATALAVAAAAVLLPALLPAAPVRVPGPGEGVDVAVVQGNVPRERATDFFIRTREVAENHVSLHRELVVDPPDVAVWPENALDIDPTQDPALGAAVSSAVREVGVPTLAGAITDAPNDRFLNQVLLFQPDGTISARYSKVHPVPFGEYVPFRRFLGWVDELRAVPRDIVPGHSIQPFEVAGLRVGTPICFENAFPNVFRQFVAAGAEVMVVATNDSSYADSPASREHVIMSQLRGVETGRWVMQAAISGHSALIDPRGRVVAQTGLFERAILRARVPPASETTPYVRWGDWFPWAMGSGAALALLIRLARLRRGERGATPPAGERGRPSPGYAPTPAPIAGAAPRVLVVLPTYNERETIGTVLEGVLRVGPSVEALVVDDGSPDGTADVVRRAAAGEPRIRLLERKAKLGLASAYLAGFRAGLQSDYEVFVEMDSDLSHRPEDLAAVIDGASTNDVTIGSRYIPGGSVTNWSRLRVALSRGGNAYARLALGLPVTDSTSGFRAFRRAALLRLLQEEIHSDGYGFQIEMAYRAWRKGLAIGEVPIRFSEREHGRSKISRRIVLEALWKVAQWSVRDRVLRRRSAARYGAAKP